MAEQKKKLAIITSHPIQYNAPLFKLLAQRNIIDTKVFYTWGKSVLENKYDPGFKKEIEWDIPLLDGYNYEFLENSSLQKGTHHFKGIINPGIIEHIDKFSPDAILVYGWAFKSHLQVLRHYKRKTTLIFRGDSTLLDKKPAYKKLMRSAFLRWVYNHVGYALYVGKNNFDYFKSCGLKESQLIYAPHAVDNKIFSENSGQQKIQALALRKKLEIPEDKIIFLFAGKLEEKKNPEILLRSFSELNIGQKSVLIIVGNGALENKLKETYSGLPSIFFLDFQNQSLMPAIYYLADVFVLPSKGPEETWGLAVNEAMACGLPVVVSDKCGCAPDLVENGKNGYIFESGNEEDLKKKIKSLVSISKDALAEMGSSSKKKIENFSLQKICEAIEMLLNRTK